MKKAEEANKLVNITPRMAVISSGDLAKYDRWDAPFHILLKTVSAEADKIRAAMDSRKAESLALQIHDNIRSEHQACINSLSRETKPTADGRRRAIEEYPFAALAVLKAQMDVIQGQLDKDIKIQEKLGDEVKKAFNQIP